MTRYVVDASVVVKWFVPEIHGEAALRYLDPNHALAAPDLLLAEVGNILWKKVRLHEIREPEARRVIKAIRAMPLQIRPSDTLLESAFTLAVTLQRSLYDSLYLALAVAEGCLLVTADRRLYNALHKDPSVGAHLKWVEEGGKPSV